MSFDGGGEERSAVSSDLNHQLIGFSDVELQVVQSTPPLHILSGGGYCLINQLITEEKTKVFRSILK